MWLALFLGLLYMVSEPTQYLPMGSGTLPHKVGSNEVVRDLSGRDCDAPI